MLHPWNVIVPSSVGSFTINERCLQANKAHKKFLGETRCYLQHNADVHRHVKAAEGACCNRCSTFVAGVKEKEEGTFSAGRADSTACELSGASSLLSLE